MNDGELHYLTYDPEEIWAEITAAYADAGGDILYPGDEKEILLRAVQSVLVQVFAGVDHALRMQTLRYAVGDYLDVLGEQRNCPRIAAAAAKATIRISFRATGETNTMPAGTAFTADGSLFFLTDGDIYVTGDLQTVTAQVTADRTGTDGNSLLAGTQLFPAAADPAIVDVTAATDAAGGTDREDDETYRERIRESGLASVSTGPARQYEAAAMAVSSEILDAAALNGGAGVVGIYLILTEDAPASILSQVEAALSADDVRPLTDTVTVQEATPVAYTLAVQYRCDGSSQANAAIAAAAEEYQSWQDNKVGRAFDPDKLTAMLYAAGATRVIFASGSAFDGGAVAYTEIEPTERCLGTIALEEITA